MIREAAFSKSGRNKNLHLEENIGRSSFERQKSSKDLPTPDLIGVSTSYSPDIDRRGDSNEAFMMIKKPMITVEITSPNQKDDELRDFGKDSDEMTEENKDDLDDEKLEGNRRFDPEQILKHNN